MIQTLTELLTEYKDATVDASSANEARGIRRFNKIQDMYCAGGDYWWLYDTFTTLTVASQQVYDFSIDHRKVVSVVVTNGTIKYPPLREIKDPLTWDTLNTSTVAGYTSDFPRYFHIRANQLNIYPASSSSGYTISVVYSKRAKPMRRLDYTTGTISVTNGSATVTGSATGWVEYSNVDKGSRIKIDDRWYEVLSINSITSITLTTTYQGVTRSGMSYTIGDTSLIHEDFQDLIWLRAAEEHLRRKDKKLSDEYKAERLELEKRMIDSSSSQTTNNIFPLFDGYNRNASLNSDSDNFLLAENFGAILTE